MAQEAIKAHHLPVMAAEVVDLLITDRSGAYLDLTVGLGGHLKALALALEPTARLIGLDKDAAAVELATRNLSEYQQVRKLIWGSYCDFDLLMAGVAQTGWDGILLDLGVSSYQLDHPERGFAFRLDAPLDMRFDPTSNAETAAALINNASEEKLREIIWTFGEERQARRIARAVIKARERDAFRTTGQLARIVTDAVPGPFQTKSLARVFQALRIAVNRELEQLQAVLPKTVKQLKTGGRLAVISYHSLEDRIVKRFFQKEAKGCVCPPKLPQCACGALPGLKILTRKALIPNAQEKAHNPRSRSARLRIAQKVSS
ncbi:MAG TPA: 16S rRNA (cytosine(1402)-N(4))-methyltransferase RsmH [Candidatus Deferrimicrobium sp.]|nr:16S rRNA (cytosine(1402)-N(4))-methyltransferase RsmH [Candidatus Deferrimicrobium sp.]